jgi:uncharacterized membrane protein
VEGQDVSNFVLWIHVLAAGAWFGTNVVQAVAPPLMARGGDATMATWHRATSDFGTRIYTPAAIILLLTGVELVRSRGWSYGDTFVLVGIGTVVVGSVLGAFVFGPGGRAAGDAIDAGDRSNAGAAVNRLRGFITLDTALLLFTIYAMTTKLGA